MIITSNANQTYKRYRGLLDKKSKRQTEQCFVVEGPRMIREIPDGLLVHCLYKESYTGEKRGGEKGYDLCADALFDKLSDTVSPQGSMAIVKRPAWDLAALLSGKDPFLLLLDGLQDPGNLGTIIRTAEAAGVTAVLASQDTVELFNPKVVRSTMGAVFRLPYLIVTDLTGGIQDLKKAGFRVLGTDVEQAKIYFEENYRGRCAVVIGNEGNGMKPEVKAACTGMVHIPMAGKTESLNASVAAGILMFEAGKQRLFS